MDRLQLRNETRGVIKEILKFIVEEIEEEIEAEATRLKRKRKWVNDKNKLETSYLLTEIPVKGPSEHFSALRMTEESFNWLLEKVEPFIQKTDTVMRMALPAILKLEIVLHLLATGSSLRILELLFGVSKTSICLMIPKVCDAIYKILQDYIRVPSNPEDWKAVEAGFRDTWNFPGCCGAIDGKYVVMKSQSDTGHYKHQNRIALLALCDDDYCFKYIDICCNVKISRRGFYQDSNLNKALENDLLPQNHVIVGDNDFPLKSFLMTPYDGNSLSDKEKIFNNRLSRARRVIDNSFGILVSRFRVFEKPIPFTPDKIEKIVKACCALHNWFRMTKCDIQITTLDVEDTATGNIIPGSWRDLPTEALAELPRKFQDCSSEDACQSRDKYADYFMGQGAFNWQLQMINESHPAFST